MVISLNKNDTSIKKQDLPYKVTWGPAAAVLVTFGAYFAGLAAQLVAGLTMYSVLLVLRWPESRIEDWVTHATLAHFFMTLALAAAVLALVWTFMRYRKATPAMIGLIKPKLKDIGYALVGFILYLPVYLGLISILMNLIPALDVEQEQQIGFEQAAGAELILVFMALVIFVPIVEEILVRGFLYSGLRSKFSKLPAALITSILFGVAHLQLLSGQPPLWVAAVDTFTLSLVLIYLRERTGGLWASIGLHALKNGVAFLALFVFHFA